MELELEDTGSDLVQEENDQQRYRSARKGAHLMKVHFECDLCHFRNMNKRDPVSGGKRDKDMFFAIQRDQLDVLWSRETSTVASNFSRLRRDYLDSTTMLSIEENILPYLPIPKGVDRVGMIPAIMTFGASFR